MQRVYIANTLLDAQLALDTLRALHIEAHVLNAHAAGALGEVPFTQAMPEIWVSDDSQAERAREVLMPVQLSAPQAEKFCPRCGEVNPGNFLSCWHCGGTLAAT
ncbi:MAG: DUF2007 domain-containing protein [Thiobacillus sp.]